jgi:hypothetical protein
LVGSERLAPWRIGGRTAGFDPERKFLAATEDGRRRREVEVSGHPAIADARHGSASVARKSLDPTSTPPRLGAVGVRAERIRDEGAVAG